MSIKLFIQTDKFKGGPAVFRSRLISELNKYEDIKVITNVEKKFDIELAFIRNVYKHNKPYILRVDGCYYMEKKLSNEPLKKAIKNAKYLIFQSKFSFELCKKVLDLGDNLKYSIIYNGVDSNYIEQIKPHPKIPPGSFVSCGRWRDNKRPMSTIRGFLEADTKRHLYMIGGQGLGGKKIDKKYNSKYVHVLDKKSLKNTISIMKACDYQIHLCHIDSCPNTVVEGLACGLNTLCTNLGGTKELVRENGVILEVDKWWKGKQMKSQKLDNLNKKVVAEGIHKVINIKQRSMRKDLDIKSTAFKYIDIIKKHV